MIEPVQPKLNMKKKKTMIVGLHDKTSVQKEDSGITSANTLFFLYER